MRSVDRRRRLDPMWVWDDSFVQGVRLHWWALPGSAEIKKKGIVRYEGQTLWILDSKFKVLTRGTSSQSTSLMGVFPSVFRTRPLFTPEAFGSDVTVQVLSDTIQRGLIGGARH